jgi:hypothetical protein
VVTVADDATPRGSASTAIDIDVTEAPKPPVFVIHSPRIWKRSWASSTA